MRVPNDIEVGIRGELSVAVEEMGHGAGIVFEKVITFRMYRKLLVGR